MIGLVPPDGGGPTASGPDGVGAPKWLPLEHPPRHKASASAAAAAARPCLVICRRIPVIPRRYIYQISPMLLLYQEKSGHPKAARKRG